MGVGLRQDPRHGDELAGRLGATTYLVPPVAIALGWVLLGETPPALALPGGLLCLLGVLVARGWSPARRPGQAVSAAAISRKQST